MTSKSTTNSSIRSALTLAACAAALAGLGAFAYWHGNKEPDPTASTANATASGSPVEPARGSEEAKEREAAFLAADAKGRAEAATWPRTEAQLFQEFWQAVYAGDIDRACVFCPGAKASDFAVFKQFKPLSGMKALGQPQAHPTQQGVQVWPVTVPFSGYPNKTIKMATFRTSDGRLAIDGGKTIWW